MCESFENYEEYMVEAYNVKDALIADVVLVYSDVAEQQISSCMAQRQHRVQKEI